MTSNTQLADIAALTHENADYLTIAVTPKGGEVSRFKVSVMAADLLIAELTALRNSAPLPAEVGEVDIIMRAGKCGHHHVGGCQSCEDALAYNNDQLDRLRTQLAAAEAKAQEMAGEIERLRDGLRQWKCPSCGGSGDYLNHSREHGEELVPCKVCEVTGLHPIARLTLKDKDNGK